MTPFHSGFDCLVRVFDSLEIPFLIGGSIASSTFGISRATNDVDILADLRPSHVSIWVERLKPDFPVWEDEVMNWVRQGRPFNLIHPVSVSKFDIFLARRPFDYSQLGRRRFEVLDILGDRITAPVSSPEDTVLSKLVWFRDGGGVSEKQWSDLRGIVRLQRNSLDQQYLDHWARELGVADLLARAQA